MWQFMRETQSLLKEIDAELKLRKDEITEFGGLIRSEQLEREYCVAIGAIQGLSKVKQLIEEMKADDDETP